MRTPYWLPGLLLCCPSIATSAAVSDLARHLGKTPALVVVVCRGGDRDQPLVAEMVDKTPWTVLCRGPASPGMEALREWARREGHLGGRVSVFDGPAPSLWLAADMADAVWIAPGADSPSEREILRVLRPGGVCVASGEIVVKPEHEGTDDWRHPYHGPDNNVVSEDRVARLPGELRFQTHPVFAAMPNQTLFAGGRIFFFTGHIAFHEREEPLLNTLTVLNAYNGLKLWSRRLAPNRVVHNVAKLATDDAVLFAEGDVLWMLDAATGDQRGEFQAPAEAAAAGDTDWKWIAQEGDVLWAAFGPPDAGVVPHRQKGEMGHWPWTVANRHYASIVGDFGSARTLAAFSYPEMELRWIVREAEPFDARTLCMKAGRIFTLAPENYMAARDTATGETLWRHTRKSSKDLFDAIGTALKRQGWGLGWATYGSARTDGRVVCIAGPSFRKTIGVSLASGELLWSLPVESPHPFFAGDGLYIMPRVGGPQTVCQKLNPVSGDVRDRFALGVIGSCTRLTVTPGQFYFRPGGGEGRTVYVDFGARKLADYEGIVRPGCFDGVVPANGRLYWMPLACDCWQVHGTFSMAPRAALGASETPDESTEWAMPTSSTPAAVDDWPMFRADPAGRATVPTSVGQKATVAWKSHLPGRGLTAPICAQGRVFVGSTDGTVYALDVQTGETLWRVSTRADVLYPPTYSRGRVVFGSCDGFLYCVDAVDGRMLGSVELAPERRFVNVMDRFMSAWPLGGGVLVNSAGTAFTAAGSTAADGAVVAAVDLADGAVRWRRAYTLDRQEPRLSFGVQGNLLHNDDTLYVNGGAPVGIVAIDAATGENARVVSRLEAGRDMFIEPDGRLGCIGPDLFSHARTRTTIFKRHQGRVYFQTSGRHLGLIDGRLFSSRDRQALDRIVDLMNKDPKTGGKMGGGTVPQDVMQLPVEEPVLWASDTADVRGMAVGADGAILLHRDKVAAVSPDGRPRWTCSLAARPVSWGVALTGDHCVVTLSDGTVACLAKDAQGE